MADGAEGTKHRFRPQPVDHIGGEGLIRRWRKGNDWAVRVIRVCLQPHPLGPDPSLTGVGYMS